MAFNTAPLPGSVTYLIEKTIAQAANLKLGNLKMRKELLITARSLYLALETPMEAVLRIGWAEPALIAALNLSVDIKLFEYMASDGGSAKTLTQLAKKTATNSTMLSRVLKHMASMGVVTEVGPDLYAPRPLSEKMIIPEYQDSIRFCSNVLSPALFSLPTYLANSKFRNPTTADDGAFQLAHQTTLHFFAYLKEHPGIAMQFNNHMRAYGMSRARWASPGCVPVEEVLFKDASHHGDAVLLVDIGGGSGHDINIFRDQHPGVPGRLILQDLSDVIDACSSSLPAGIEAMSHDFFNPQPIKGARAYYLHSILHDWPDDKCHDILKNIVLSMTRGYSKILINENVVPDREAYWETTGLDILMMAVFSAKERTEQNWRDLLEPVGLRIVNIWTYEKGTESLIEAELA